MTPRVLMVTGAYYPEISSGGVQCQTMARLLLPRARIHVLTTAVDETLPRHAVVEGVPVSRIMVDVTSAPSRIRAARRMFLELLRLARRCDVVHVHGCSSKNILVALVARLLRRRLVLSLHTAGYDEPEAVKQQGRLAWWAFRSADLCLSVSPALVNAYLAAGLPAERIRQVPNGIDTERFSPATPAERAALRHRLGLDQGRPVVVSVGFFSHDKQPRMLFDAWLQLRDTHGIDATLLFVGATSSPYFEVDPQLAEGIRADVERLGLCDRVVFAGVTQNVADYLRSANVFVLPSRREGLPVALLEAMACGLPCVASRLPGATDNIIVDGENGVLVAVGQPAAFASAIARFLQNASFAVDAGAAARDTVVRRFASADVALRWLSAYNV
jgi:glycosyltransferase involved in cell wall biosynthesis